MRLSMRNYGPGPCNKREEDEETSPKSREFLDQNSDADGWRSPIYLGWQKDGHVYPP